MSRFALLSLLLFAPLASAGDAQVFGGAMPAGVAQPVAVAIAALDGGEVDAAPRKFAGRITEVCQAKGCWVMLEDEGRAVRVMMKDHAFALPKDARGAAHVYGALSVKELDAKTARHLAADAGRDAPGAAREYRIEALSVELAGG